MDCVYISKREFRLRLRLWLLFAGLCLFLQSPPVFADILSPAERQWLENAPEIRFAPAPNYPPVEFFDENDIYRGTTADFVRYMREQVGINLKIVQLKDWNQVIEKSKAREVDVWGGALPGRRSAQPT
ncbi:hypothetical protein BOW51_01395 [Solemya velesiana gill symbiont]|uniref:Solute-binding protein family 3/N-terminal domain-containing protein n=2 Tax=Solemya velesiana gill symbiont TaxID=1918948 RepID=A0A1T2KXS4_9GAMM|nr:hypothetical protein BOW51_01395 [Solemya velesiana gill symbiont]